VLVTINLNYQHQRTIAHPHPNVKRHRKIQQLWLRFKDQVRKLGCAPIQNNGFGLGQCTLARGALEFAEH
jgi:hypothetical protein